MPAASAGPRRSTERISTPSRVGQRQRRSELGRELLRLDAEPSPRDFAVADDLLENAAGDGDRDGEADALRSAALRVDHAVDADEVAAAVDQRATGVAGIHRGVGLDEVLEAIDAEVVAAERADDAVRHRAAEVERTADREHGVADLHVLELAEGHRRKVLAVGLEHREVGFRIAAAHGGAHAPPVGEHELYVVGVLDHVIVGEHVAFAADDHSRAEARRSPRSSVGQPREESPHDRIVGERIALPDLLAGVDVDDRWHRLARRVGEALDLGRSDGGGSFLDEHDVVAPGEAREQIGPQRDHDEKHRQADRGDLGKQQPEAAKHRATRV